MKKRNYLLPLGLVLLASCGQPASKEQSISGGYGHIEAINHTKWAINRFSVDGQSGLDIIGPYDGGGGGCCYGVPAKWQPGMMVQVDWETGVAFASDVPEIPEPDYPETKGMDKDTADKAWKNYTKQKREWFKKIATLKRQHRKIVPLPDYTGQKTCGITVHFLPCDEIKVTTSCFVYGSPSYPIKLPLKMEEPKVCPQ